MKTTVALEFKTDGLDAAGQSVGSFKKQLREAQGELVAMADKFGLASSQAQNAAKKVAGLKDSIGDAKALADTFNPDKKFVALGGALQGVTAGFSAYSGAMGLLGVKSEETEKLLLKVQSAMALQQGISGIAGAVDSFKLLGKAIQSSTAFQKIFSIGTVLATTVQKAFGVAVTTTSTGFKVLRTAIISTGIGALVVLITTVISSIVDWIGGNEDLEKSQERLKAAIDETNKSIDQSIKSNSRATEEAIALAKSLGKSEKEIYKIRANGSIEDERLTGVRLRSLYAFYETQEGLFKKGKIDEKDFLSAKNDYTDAYSNYEDLKSKQRIDKFNEEGRVRAEGISAAQKAQDKATANSQKNAAEAKAEAKKAEEIRVAQAKNSDALILENRILAIKDEFLKTSFQLAIKEQEEIDAQLEFLNKKEINKEEYEKRALLINDKYKVLQGDLLTAKEAKDEETLKATREKELTDLKAHSEAKLAEVLRVNAASGEDSPEAAMLKIENIAAAKLEAENAAYLIEKEQKAGQLGELALLEENHKNKLITIEKDAAAEKKAIAEAELAHKKAMQQADLDLIGQGIGFLKSLAGNNKALQKAGVIAENALGIAKIIIATNAANAGALATPQAIATSGAAAIPVIIRNKIAAAIGIASTIAATAKALSAIGGGGGATSGGSVGGGSGGGSSAVTAPLAPQAQVTNLSQSSINAVGNAANRAYVLETDVSNNQERIRRLNRASRIN